MEPLQLYGLYDVEPPSNFGGYPESLDWLEFRVDDAFDLFHWRIEIFAGSIPST